MDVGKIDNIVGARALGIFGDSVTTDHLSPAGAIKATSPAGEYLKSRGIRPEDFNRYGSRRRHALVLTPGPLATLRPPHPTPPPRPRHLTRPSPARPTTPPHHRPTRT